jgi:large subunit ribosomal protein L31
MKKGIHPNYYENAVIRCACGAEYRIGSTRPEIRVEVCSKCHPFFTGETRFVDTEGKIEKFMKKYGHIYQAKKEGE